MKDILSHIPRKKFLVVAMNDHKGGKNKYKVGKLVTEYVLARTVPEAIQNFEVVTNILPHCIVLVCKVGVSEINDQ